MSGNPFAPGNQEPLYGLAGELAALLKRSIRKLLLTVLENRILHAEVVAAGEFTFRHVFVKDLGPVFGNNRVQADALADLVYRMFREQWRERYPDITPEVFLDKVAIISPPTEDEIEDAWEIEIASDESAMRSMYEGSARTRKGRDMGLKHKLERPH